MFNTAVTGSLPSTVGALTNLQYATLSEFGWVGGGRSLECEHVSFLLFVPRSLSAHGSPLNGTLPSTLGLLTALTLLDVSQTGVTALPSTFANMTALRCVLAGRLCVLSSEF